MNIKETIEILRKHNEWRRYDGEVGKGPEMIGPKTLGEAIDTAISELESMDKPKYHKTNPLFDECVKNCDPEIMKQVSDKIDDISRAEKKAPDTIFIPYDYILDGSLPAGVTEKLTFEGDIEYIRKDLAALTIEDIERLHTFLYAVKNNKQGVFTFTLLTDEQYEEVLRRFNKRKNK